MDVHVLLASLIRNSFWMKVLGVFFIVYGVITCITIIGLVIGWLPIWLGVLLFTSAKRLDVIKEYDSPEDAVESIEKISLYFKISGILVLVYVAFLVVLLLFFSFSSFMDVSGW